MTADPDTIDEILASDAGAHLFNGITQMGLVDRNGKPVRFSRRRELTQHVIGLMLEVGYRPVAAVKS